MTVKELDVKARWFAGKGRRISALLEEDRLGPLAIARVDYADGARERYLLLDDELSWPTLLRSLTAAPLDGSAGRLELRGSLPLDALTGARVPSTDQTNTLVALGERLLLKAYRRLHDGVHPEVELLAALAPEDAPVPRAFGSLHYVAADGGDTAVALLCEFVADAEGGWEGPIERVASFLRAEGPEPHEEYRAAGRTTAKLHAALADAFPSRPGEGSDAARARCAAEALLADAAAGDPEVAALAPRLQEPLRALDALEGAMLQRIHGDLHYAQLLRGAAGHPDPLVIDFEGDPTLPLADRRRPGPPLHDLACLLRSIDHIGSAASRRADGRNADAWIARATAAALDGYGRPVDHPLLRALECAKEIGELLYARRVVPDWTYAPRAGLRRLLEKSVGAL